MSARCSVEAAAKALLLERDPEPVDGTREKEQESGTSDKGSSGKDGVMVEAMELPFA